MGHQEPQLSFLVLDYLREEETRRCLESLKKHAIFPHKVIYLHNGLAEYPHEFLKSGLIDQLLQPRRNNGLGVGTRDLFAASFSPYSCYVQNDQYVRRDWSEEELQKILGLMGSDLQSPHDGSIWRVMSVDIAGGYCGEHIYSDRAFIMPTDFYKKMEASGMLGLGGPGPWYGEPDREKPVQGFYKTSRYLHYTYKDRLFDAIGVRGTRENRDGSVWEENEDTGGIRLLKGPVRERAFFPFFTDEEWERVLKTQSWPEWQVPHGKRSKD